MRVPVIMLNFRTRLLGRLPAKHLSGLVFLKLLLFSFVNSAAAAAAVAGGHSDSSHTTLVGSLEGCTISEFL
jgi:hypothetical protein